MHSNIALAKSYSQVKKHAAVATGSFTVDLGDTFVGSTTASGTIRFGRFFREQPLDCNFCHIAFMVYTTAAADR